MIIILSRKNCDDDLLGCMHKKATKKTLTKKIYLYSVSALIYSALRNEGCTPFKDARIKSHC